MSRTLFAIATLALLAGCGGAVEADPVETSTQVATSASPSVLSEDRDGCEFLRDLSGDRQLLLRFQNHETLSQPEKLEMALAFHSVPQSAQGEVTQGASPDLASALLDVGAAAEDYTTDRADGVVEVESLEALLDALSAGADVCADSGYELGW